MNVGKPIGNHSMPEKLSNGDIVWREEVELRLMLIAGGYETHRWKILLNEIPFGKVPLPEGPGMDIHRARKSS